MVLLSAFLAFCFHSMGLTAVSAGQTYLAARDSHNRLLVSAYVGSQGPYPFLLDSGADTTVINDALVLALNLEAVPLRSSRVFTSTGQRFLQVYSTGPIDALGLTVSKRYTPALPLPRAGPLGVEHYGTFGVDLLKRQTVLMTRDESVQILRDGRVLEEAGWFMIQGRRAARGSIAVQVDILGEEIAFLVDTGASNTVLNGVAGERLEQKGLKKGMKLRLEGAAGLKGRGYSLHMNRTHKNQIPIWLKGGDQWLVADLPVFRHLGATKKPAGLLGMDHLSKWDFAMDFRYRRLFIRTDPDKMALPEPDISQ